MRVDGIVYADERIMRDIQKDESLQQVRNVAHLPGIVGASIAMPDIHWGYGFPIGGVAATDVDAGGVVSPGGVGFDIGCGVRLLRSELSFEGEGRPKLRELVATLGRHVPRGVGGKGAAPLDGSQLERVLKEGVRFTLSLGIGWEEDAELTEDGGALPNPVPDLVSDRAKERGAAQLGSLG